jgi:hypothetical protein
MSIDAWLTIELGDLAPVHKPGRIFEVSGIIDDAEVSLVNE